VNSDQLRMARALLRMTILDLAEAAGVDKMTLLRFEAGRTPRPSTIKKLQTALEERGVIFVGPLVPFTQATVALRHGLTPADPRSSGDDEADDDNDGDERLARSLDEYWSRPENKKRLSPEGQKALLVRRP
jgi:transcriptional regulator with XRE-family HTH domain